MRFATISIRLETALHRSVTAAVISLALLISGCGGSNGSSSPAAVNSTATSPSSLPMGVLSESFAFTADTYGMENATYLSATKSSLGIVLRAAVATSMTDPDFRTVSRIDIANPDAVTAGTVYSLGTAPGGTPIFPGTLYFFNGHQSTLLRTVGGTITFHDIGKNPGDAISGSFSALVEDGADTATPKPVYSIAGSFSFTTERYGAVLPAPVPVPTIAASVYSAKCASCHALGGLDTSPGGGPDVARKGGKLNSMFPADTAGHNGITLAGTEMSALKVLLNVN